MSTGNTQLESSYLVSEYGGVEILGAKTTHKYLGRGFYEDIRNRGNAALEHRFNAYG